MIATVTVGKRRVGMPSESGSTRASSGRRLAGRIGDLSDPLREARARPLTASFAHRFGALADSGDASVGESRLVTYDQEVITMSTPFEEVGHLAQTQLKKARWALGISGA